MSKFDRVFWQTVSFKPDKIYIWALITFITDKKQD